MPAVRRGRATASCGAAVDPFMGPNSEKVGHTQSTGTASTRGPGSRRYPARHGYGPGGRGFESCPSSSGSGWAPVSAALIAFCSGSGKLRTNLGGPRKAYRTASADSTPDFAMDPLCVQSCVQAATGARRLLERDLRFLGGCSVARRVIHTDAREPIRRGRLRRRRARSLACDLGEGGSRCLRHPRC